VHRDAVSPRGRLIPAAEGPDNNEVGLGQVMENA